MGVYWSLVRKYRREFGWDIREVPLPPKIRFSKKVQNLETKWTIICQAKILGGSTIKLKLSDYIPNQIYKISGFNPILETKFSQPHHEGNNYLVQSLSSTYFVELNPNFVSMNSSSLRRVFNVHLTSLLGSSAAGV